MKVKFVGHAAKVSVRLPIGIPRKEQTSVVHFEQVAVHDFSEADGKKLLSLNQHSGFFVDVSEMSESEPVEVLNVEEPKNSRIR